MMFYPQVCKKKKNNVHVTVLCRVEALADFRAIIEGTNWNDVYNDVNPNLSYNIFLCQMKHIYGIAFPLQSVRKHKKSRKLVT